MRRAGDVVKGGGNRQDLRPRLRKAAKQMRKAQVIADRHADLGKSGVRENRLVAGPIGRGFAVNLGLGHVHIKHVNLVIARGYLARGRDQEGPVGKAAVRVMGQHADRADQQPDPRPRRLIPQGGQGGVIVLVAQHGALGGVGWGGSGHGPLCAGWSGPLRAK